MKDRLSGIRERVLVATTRHPLRVVAFTGVTGVLLGLVLASVTGGSIEDDPRFKARDERIADLSAKFVSAEQRAKSAETLASNVEARELAVEEALEDMVSREDDVAARERTVGIVEKKVAARTVSGDGVYEVGTEMRAGTYKSKDNSQCYWSINADPNGDDIISNHIGSGPMTVQVSKGQFFETTRCNDWVRQ